MTPVQAQLAKAIPPDEGLHDSPVPGVQCVRITGGRTRPEKTRWPACLAIIVQGTKEITLGRKVYRCDALHYTMTPIVLPVVSRIESASRENPFLGLLIDLEPVVLSAVMSQLPRESTPSSEPRVSALFVGKATEKMLEAVLRLVELFRSPEDAGVIGPLVTKEIIYYLLKGPEGAAIRQFLRAGSQTHRISQAVHAMRSGLGEPLDVPALARAATMSRSAFFKHFREATAMSPIQYQKRLRLLEARRLLTEEGETAQGSAFRVGYNSASQFSREYSRMFGRSPLRDATRATRR